jgi:hypothetical protein
MIDYISISTIKNILDTQLIYNTEFQAVDGISPYRWNSVKIIIYDDDTEKEKAIKTSLFYAIKKLVSTYHEEFETVVENGNIHYLFGTANNYGGYDMWIQYGEEEEEE